MLNKKLIDEVIKVALSTGADFAEVFLERNESKTIGMRNRAVEQIEGLLSCGMGLRIYKGTKSVNASTADLSREGVLSLARQVSQVLKGSAIMEPKALVESIGLNTHQIKIVPSSIENKRKIDILKEAYFAAFDYDSVISQVFGRYIDKDRTIWIANSDGLYVSDRQIYTRLNVQAISSNGTENQSGFFGPGRRMGLEAYEGEINPRAVGIEAARQAKVNLSASYCKAGQYPVAIENGFGGVLFHESCGHSLEATSVAYNNSQMCGKLNQKVGCDKLTVIDDGTIKNAWGSINIDDEGHVGQKNVLIENGVLKSYMIDRFNGRRMNSQSTGNARRQSFVFEPTSRMTNTYIAAGPDEDEDIIGSMELGVYAKTMGGGSVNPLTGSFNFAIAEAYMVRNGKICEPVRGASLVGTGSQIISDIDMVGKHVALGEGMCGSSSGSIPVCVGQPLIRVKNITVGGR